MLVLAYFETRPPTGIELAIARPMDDLGIWEGVRIINNTGGDLLNCWVDIIEWDVEVEIPRMAARWVRRDRQPVEIPYGEGISSYFIHRWNGTMRATLSDQDGPQLPEDETEIGLWFHANTIKGDTITMPFWVNVNVQLVEDRHEITIKEVST